MKVRVTFAMFVAVVLLVQGASASISAQAGPNPAATSLGIAHGAYIVPTLNYGTEISLYNAQVNKKLAVDMYFTDWRFPFDPFLPNQIRNQLPPADRPVIMITWLPQNGRQAYGCDRDYDGAVPLSNILAGDCDPYIRQYAQVIKQRPERFIMRFANEMNISDSVYWPGHFGQDASAFVAMWRHVYDVFKSEGVHNVEWMWSPNYASYPPDAWNGIHNYYPGNNYVDWVGVDGYNWYTSYSPPLSWATFTKLFDSVLKDFACRYPKPAFVAEFGSVEGAGTKTKAGWISDAFQQMASHPFVRGFIWFNDYAPNQADFRVTTSTATSGGVSSLPTGNGDWTNAYKNALASSIYKTTLPTLSVATPPTTYCGTGEAAFTVSPPAAILEPGQSSSHTLTGMLYSSTTNLSLILPPKVTGSITPSQLPPPWGKAQINLQTSATIALGAYTVTVQAGSAQFPIQVVVVNSVQRVYLPLTLR